MPHNKIPRPVPRSRFFLTFRWRWWTWRKSIWNFRSFFPYSLLRKPHLFVKTLLTQSLKIFEWVLAFHVKHWVLGMTMRGYKAMQATDWVGYSTVTKVHAQFIIQCSFIKITHLEKKFDLTQHNVTILIWTGRKKPLPAVLQGVIAMWQHTLPLLWRRQFYWLRKMRECTKNYKLKI